MSSIFGIRILPQTAFLVFFAAAAGAGLISTDGFSFHFRQALIKGEEN